MSLPSSTSPQDCRVVNITRCAKVYYYTYLLRISCHLTCFGFPCSCSKKLFSICFHTSLCVTKLRGLNLHIPCCPLPSPPASYSLHAVVSGLVSIHPSPPGTPTGLLPFATNSITINIPPSVQPLGLAIPVSRFSCLLQCLAD